MKEAFFAKQLSLCKTTRELQQWADLNCGLDGGVSYRSTLKVLPKVFHQTNKADHEKLGMINSMMLPHGFERKFYDDARCEAYIKRMLGPTALEHYNNLTIPAHRADFFRYVLMFYEGGVYLDIKSCFLLALEEILERCDECSFLTCIGEAGAHIHQGILMSPAGHPLLREAILKVMETPPNTMGPRSSSYMRFCKQMWTILQNETGGRGIKQGQNETATWGSVFLMAERKERKTKSLAVRDKSIRIDGHIAYMGEVAASAAVAVRCEGWNRGFDDMQDIAKLETFATMSVSALDNEGDMGIVEIEQGRNQQEQGDAQPSTEKKSVEQVVEEQQKYYKGLTAEELHDFILEGLVATNEGWLACSVHRKKNRGKMFATWC